MIKTIFRLFLAFLVTLIAGQTWASVSASQDDGYQYDVNSVVLGTQSYDYDVATKLRNNGVRPPPEALSRKVQGGSFFTFADGFFVTNKTTKEVLTRKSKGGDGGTSQQIIERDASSKEIISRHPRYAWGTSK